MSNLSPTYDKIIVKPEEKSNKVSIAGKEIEVVGSTDNKRADRGIVVAMGPGRWENNEYAPMPCSVGDTVIYGKFAGDKFDVGDEELFFIRSTDVIAVIEEEDE